MKKTIVAIIVTAMLSGCQTADDTLTTSSTPIAVTGATASAIAGDMAGRYAEQAGSTATPIRLHSDASDFATALEAALKGWGFTVVTDDKALSLKDTAKPIELAYSLIDVDGQVLVRLSSETLELGRAYSVSSGGATPASPLSLMKRN